MGIKQLYNDNLRNLPNEYGDISVMLAPGLYTCIKSLKMYIKSDFEKITLNLQNMDKDKRAFCCQTIFVPNGLSAFAWGYIHVKKTKTKKKTNIKNGKKADVKEICFKLATNGQSDKGFLLTSTFCPQGVVCPCPGAIYTYKII